jgi:hypothetical protein
MEKVKIHTREADGRFSRAYVTPGVFLTFKTMKNLRSWCAKHIAGVHPNDTMVLIGDEDSFSMRPSIPFFREGSFVVCFGDVTVLVVVEK